MTLFVPRPSPASEYLRLFVLISLAIDLALIVAYTGFLALQAFGIMDLPDKANIENPGSLANIWGYGKFFVISISLAITAIVFPRRGWGYLASLIFLLLIDDYAEIHDRVGRAVGARLDVGALDGLPVQDQGEPLVYAGMLVIALVLAGLAFLNLPADHRPAARKICWFVVALAAFGVGVDVVHSAINMVSGSGGIVLGRVTGIIEEGGEAVVLSLMLGAAASICFELLALKKASLQSPQAASSSRC